MTDVPFTVVMAGSGELEQELRAFCEQHALDNVVFTGFVNQSELPALYAASDIFVLPSEHEPWGLAVNEAMCAGLPVVVSREVGCALDLVQDGVNGYTPAAGDIEGLALRSRAPDRRRRPAATARSRPASRASGSGVTGSAWRAFARRWRAWVSVVRSPGLCGQAGCRRPDVQRCVVLPASTLIITRPIRSIAPSCRRIRDHMAARGPDGLGEWYSQDERVGFGHRRLTIIDLSERGAQPMTSADGKLVVTFNGEIYNYRQLRAAARSQRPHVFARKPTRRSCCTFTPKKARQWSMICAACLRSGSGTPRRTPFCSRGILTASSRYIMPTMAGLFALHRRSRRCWPVARSHAIRNRRVGLDFVCSAAFRNPLRRTRKSVLCLRDRRFGWIASALARQSSIFPSPIRTAVRKPQARRK